MRARLSGDLLRVFFDQAATWRLMVFSIAGYAFSLAVILGTLGLMDGFESTLKHGLRLAAGDAVLTHRSGFFEIHDDILEEMHIQGARAVAGIVQSEAFALSDGRSKGVLVRGVELKDFPQVTGMKFVLAPEGIAIGKTLATEWGLAVGDTLSLVLARGVEGELPSFLSLKVNAIVEHGIHEKDARLVYVRREELQNVLAVGSKFNMALIAMKGEFNDMHALEDKVGELAQIMGSPWVLRPAWQEFASLLEAVEVEKTSIAIVLQLIVLVAVFNVAAFLMTLHARKLREFFLLRAFGLARGQFLRFASVVLIGIWATSCVGALGLIRLFNWLLWHVSWLQVPGDIYVLTRLQVLLSLKDYLWVFGLALLWMGILGGLAARKLRKQTLLAGLRQEFQ
jgi:ABC-type lipoprotein release transport system permease subunit